MNDYPENWKEIAQAVKDKARWRCVRCDHRHDVKNHYVLTVHHLDGDKSNNKWWNLVALCQRCHLSIQGRVRMEQGFLFPELHSAWLRPYLKGWMEHDRFRSSCTDE
jgi:hypothetical protein